MACALDLFVDGQARGEQVAKDEPEKAGGNKADSVVKITTKAEPKQPGADGKQEVSVTFKIDSGWHIYANPVANDAMTESQTTLAVASKVKLKDVKIDYPDGKEIDDKVLGKYKVYEETATIKGTIQRAAGDKGPLELTLKFMACNDKMCLPPVTKKITIP